MPSVEENTQRGHEGKLLYPVQDSAKPWAENTVEPQCTVCFCEAFRDSLKEARIGAKEIAQCLKSA